MALADRRFHSPRLRRRCLFGPGLALAAVVLALLTARSAAQPPAAATPVLQYLPVGTLCRGTLPCTASGDFGIHLRLVGAATVDDQRIVRSSLLVPSVIVSALHAGECGAAFPLRFYGLALPVPERLRLFCKLTLPKALLPTSGGALFANVNLAYGPFAEAARPAGRHPTTVDVGGVLSGDLGALVQVAAAFWATVGDLRPQLHAGTELLLRTDLVTVFAQAQFFSPLGDSPTRLGGAWGLVGTLGLRFPSAVAPTSAYVLVGWGDAAPAMVLAGELGMSYDGEVRARYGDGHAAVERGWDRLFAPLRYRLKLRRRGYYDPYPDSQGLLRDDLDHSVLGILGIPDPTRPGFILTPFGISVPVGASLEIRGDRPFVASPAFPGRVLSYIPVGSLTNQGGAQPVPLLDELYFTRLEAERQYEELLVQDALRQMDSPWATAALNAVAGLLTEPMLLMLAAAGPDTPNLETLRRQTRLVPYRPGYEAYKGELAETVLVTYGSLLGPWAASLLRTTGVVTARELASLLAALRTQRTIDAAAQPPRLLSGLAPRLHPGNYRFALRGLGSNLGNVKVRFVGTEAEAAVGEVAEHLAPPEPALPPLTDKARAHIYFGDTDKGKSTGWHYEPTGDATQGTYVVESTRSAPDLNGVYESNVYIKGVKKKAISSFFPLHWTTADIENAIEQAYRNRQPAGKLGRYNGTTASGLEIQMDLDRQGRVYTAYPIYRGGS